VRAAGAAGALQQDVELLVKRNSSLRGPQTEVACPGEPNVAHVGDYRGLGAQRAHNLACEEADRAGAGDQNSVAAGYGALAGSPDPNRHRFSHCCLFSRQPRRGGMGEGGINGHVATDRAVHRRSGEEDDPRT
jgi:hypothetical protein